MLFKLSNLNSNLALTLGYLNPALNNPAQNINSALASTFLLHLISLQSLLDQVMKLSKVTFNADVQRLSLFPLTLRCGV